MAKIIIPLSAVQRVNKAEDGIVTLHVNDQSHEFEGEKAKEVWKVFSEMSVELPSLEEPNFDWMKM